MPGLNELRSLSKDTETILCPPFEWCHVKGGIVTLEDASDYGGTQGGTYQVADFAIAKYPVTNAQYKEFLDHPGGFCNPHWWEYSPEAIQWRKDHQNPKPTAFEGEDLPRTRVSWFDGTAFCNWLSAELKTSGMRLPTEQEWQRAATGDTGWIYPWGNELDETRGNYGNHVGRPSPVGSFPRGESPFGAMDMIGNLWEWCLTIWGEDKIDPHGYTYRIIRGGAWNVSNPGYLRAIDRGEGHSPRGKLNDCGFRCALIYS